MACNIINLEGQMNYATHKRTTRLFLVTLTIDPHLHYTSVLAYQ
jgi:hypothetical protein